jgi:predicted nuclease of predicted toxin-antitoxin system
VKLLFDANLSHKLVGILAPDFPDCTHVRDIGLRAAGDGQIWNHARTDGFLIVSKLINSLIRHLRRQDLELLLS